MKLSAISTLLFPLLFQAVYAEGLSEVGELLRADPQFQAAASSCPVGAGKEAGVKKNPVSNDVKVCSNDPRACLRDCKSGDSRRCFQLALAFEVRKSEIGDATVTAQHLYAMGCRLGDAGSCTSRAAGIMHHRLETSGLGDPRIDIEEKDWKACLLRTFSATCAVDNVWGCTMKGLVLSNERLAGVQPVKAIAAFDRACELAPRSEPCRMGDSIREAAGMPPR